MLDRHSVKATFFVLGKFVAQKPEIARAVVAAGHELGIHTWDHPNLIFASPSEVRSQIERTQSIIFDTTGYRCTLMRPPFGARTPADAARDPQARTHACHVERDLLRLEADDARSASWLMSSAKCAAATSSCCTMAATLEMGADRSHSVEATELIIRKYKDEGYGFATVSQMMATVRRPIGRNGAVEG